MSRQVNTLKYNVPLDELGAPSDPLIFFQVVLVEIFCLMQVKTSIFWNICAAGTSNSFYKHNFHWGLICHLQATLWHDVTSGLVPIS